MNYKMMIQNAMDSDIPDTKPYYQMIKDLCSSGGDKNKIRESIEDSVFESVHYASYDGADPHIGNIHFEKIFNEIQGLLKANEEYHGIVLMVEINCLASYIYIEGYEAVSTIQDLDDYLSQQK